MNSRAVMIALACLLAVSTTGCGSSARNATTTSTSTSRDATPFTPLKKCLRKNGYAITPESSTDLGTAPRRFQFIAVWNLLNPSRVALALTISRDTAGAEQAATWTRHENTKIGRGAVSAPVVRIGRIDLLWTAEPGVHDEKGVYGCVRRQE